MTLEDENNGSRRNDSPLTLADLSVSQHSKPTVHSVQEAPLCEQCQRLSLTFFDPHCLGCSRILTDTNTSIAQIFAIIRQWVPQTQQNIEMIGLEILKRGSHIDDRDGLTDMTLLMYACKAGAMGVGDVTAAVNFSTMLINKGANVSIRCRWTLMSALHYAVYFDVAPLVRLLLKASKCEDVDSLCGEYENGTPLHIAATSCSYEAAKCLLQHGANINAKDDMGRSPIECIPDSETVELNTEMENNATKMRRMFTSEVDFQIPKYGLVNYDGVPGKVVLSSLGLKFGDQVMVGGSKLGTLRFCGTTQFATGQWAGIELDEADGKNDGSVGGISYFSCPPMHGIFAPLSKVCRPGSSPRASVQRRDSLGNLNYGRINVSHVTARVNTGLHRSPSNQSITSDPGEIETGDKVIVAGQRTGVIRFSGKTKFAPGWWYGIELHKPVGKNDGSVSGERYFTCEPRRGVFAPPSRVKKYLAGSNDSLNSLEGANGDMTGRASVGALNMSVTKRTPLRSKSVAGMQRTPRAPLSTSLSSSGEFRLQEGMSVYLNNELGIVRYIGPAHFADGVWLGVELRTAKGKNDGSIQGQRYFTCKQNHGLLVRPSRVTVRGIKGDKLIGDQPKQQQLSSKPANTSI